MTAPTGKPIGRPKGRKDNQPRKRRNAPPPSVPVAPSVLVPISAAHERQAWTIQLELIIKFFPGVNPRPIMAIADDRLDVYAHPDTLKLGPRVFHSERLLGRAIQHALVHYATNDPGHGDDFLKLEADLGLLGTTQDIECFGQGLAKAPIEQRTVRVGVPLGTLQEQINRCLKEYWEEVRKTRSKGKQKINELSKLWHVLEGMANGRKDLATIDAWRWAMETTNGREPDLPASTVTLSEPPPGAPLTNIRPQATGAGPMVIQALIQLFQNQKQQLDGMGQVLEQLQAVIEPTKGVTPWK